MTNVFDSFRKGKNRSAPETDSIIDPAFHEFLSSQLWGNCPFQFPNTQKCKELRNGEFSFGLIGFHGETLNEDPYQFNMNLGVVGGTRIGKTTMLLRLALHLMEMKNIGLFIADLKESFLSLCNAGASVIRVKDTPVNPFEHVPGTDIENHCWELGKQLSGAYYALNSGTLFNKILLKCFRENGQPTPEEFRQAVHKAKPGEETGLNPTQMISVKGKIDQLCTVLGPKICNTRHGFLPHKHADHDKIVFSLNTGSPEANAFFTTWIDWEVFTYNKAHNIRPDKLRTALIFDEAGFLLVERPDFPPYIDQLILVHSEFGIGIFAAAQLYLSTTFNANAAWKVLFKCGDTKLFRRQAESQGFDPQQTRWSQQSLGGKGDAIVSTPRCGHPLITALHPLDQPVPTYTEADLVNSAQMLVRKIESYAAKENSRTATIVESKSATPKSIQKVVGMMPTAVSLLKYIAENPGSSTTDSYKGAGLKSGDQGNRAKEFLEENNFAVSGRCRLYAKGRGPQPVILEPTATGIDYLKTHYPNLQIKLLRGRGSLEHRLHTEVVARKYQGFLIRKEHYDADLCIEDPKTGKWFAIEIVTHNEDNLEHRTKQNVKLGAYKTLIVCSSQTTAIKLSKKFIDQKEIEVQEITPYLLPRGQQLSQQRRM